MRIRTSKFSLSLAAFLLAFTPTAANYAAESEIDLPTLITSSPAEGFALAIRLSRLGVVQTQPDMSVLKQERPEYAKDAEDLIAASQVIATHFQTIAEANEYWEKRD